MQNRAGKIFTKKLFIINCLVGGGEDCHNCLGEAVSQAPN
jgi:hypothetical protein